MSYVPEFLGGLEKSRIVGHRPAVENFIKYSQITWHLLTLEELQEKELQSKYGPGSKDMDCCGRGGGWSFIFLFEVGFW